MMPFRAVLCAAVVLALIAACRQPSVVKRVIPGVPTGALSELSQNRLATLLVCHDSLGMDVGTLRTGRCLPCIPYGVMGEGRGALTHARALWRHIGRAPHDTVYLGAGCTTLAFEAAHRVLPEDATIDVEFALFRIASRNDSVRALGLARIDRLVDSLIARDQPLQAERVLGAFALGVWERAQRMLERPLDASLDVHEWERDAHDLARGAPRFSQLPPIPRTSSRLGVSEAEWSARLFDRAALLADHPARRSAWHRLALAPFVVLARWPALDSAARVMLVRSPNDSTVLPARALAAYHQVRNPVRDEPAVMAAFDTALSHMPRADSLQYDSFDDVLRRDDDEWRYGFLPSDRRLLDQRGWAVLDPLWSTRVNEVRLAKRARVAEANYRYADIAKPGESGSETRPGAMLRRRGAPDSAWSSRPVAARHIVARRWRGVEAVADFQNAPDFWRAAYAGVFDLDRVVRWPATNDGTCGSGEAREVVYDCTVADRADWTGVPFWGLTDTIDVTVSRFRAPGDSIDLYVGARLPLRRFGFATGSRASPDHRIGFGLYLASPVGDPVYERVERRELPAERTVAWTAQWMPRVSARSLMHRVEALEPERVVGARGAVLHTSDAALNFPLSGYGMSDVLVAASVRESRSPARRWADLTVDANGAVVAPGATFALAWELYDLTPGRDGRVRWRVGIRRENGAMLKRSDERALLLGGTTAGDRVVADEPDAVAVSYTRDAPASSSVLEHVKFNMGTFPPGRHVVEVRIEDLVSGKRIARSATVRVLDAATQRRGASQAPRPSPRR